MGRLATMLNSGTEKVGASGGIYDAAIKGLKLMGVGGALTAGSLGTAAAIRSIARKMTESKKYEQMLDINPDLKKVPQDRAKLVFKTLNNFAPAAASDPLVAGNFVRNTMEIGEVGLSPKAVKELLDITKAVRPDKSTISAALAMNAMTHGAASEL